MPDIAMCWGGDCPAKSQCYRYRAYPNDPYQSYFTALPYDEEVDGCPQFWDTEFMAPEQLRPEEDIPT